MKECGELVGQVHIADGSGKRQMINIYCTKPADHQSNVMEITSETVTSIMLNQDPHEFRNNGLIVRRENG